MLFAERMMYQDGATPFNALFPLRIRGALLQEQLQHALERLQEKHPVLAATVTTDADGMPWFESAVPEMAIPVRITARSSDNTWQEETVKEWSTAFDARRGPLMRLVWVRGDAVSELLLVAHHCMCDGGSALAIVKEFLLLLDQPDADIGKEQVFTQLSDIVPAAVLRSRKKILRARLLGWAGHLLLRVIPLKKKAVSRGQDYLLHWKLSEEATKDLIRRCKALGVTVNTVASLALLSAFAAVRGKRAFNKITCPVEIRRYARTIRPDAVFAFGLMLVLSMDKRPGLDFAAKAQKLQAAVSKKLDRLNAYDSLMMFEYAHPLLPRMTEFLKYSKPTNDCMFSNMGILRIPHQYRNFTVDAIFSPSVIGPLGNPTTLISSIFKQQLDFSFISAEGYIPRSEAVAIKEKLTDLLLQLHGSPDPD